MNLFTQCKNIIFSNDINFKSLATQELLSNFMNNFCNMDYTNIESIPTPGNYSKIKLVDPSLIIKRKLNTPDGIANLFHALAHIELNAINLSLDIIYRFQQMPHMYYHNWLHVAVDEVKHFNLLNNYLNQLGYNYGDFSAHNGLWDMVYKTEKDILLRLGVVHKGLEAHGLDAIPELLKKLSPTKQITNILNIIQEDEITHVSYANYWFNYICQQRQLNSSDTFISIIKQYMPHKIKYPLNKLARIKAGFYDEELILLKEI